jgi:hypothetical protein
MARNQDDDEGGAGWSGPLLGRAQGILDNLEDPGNPPVPFDPAFAWGPEGAKQSSPNHEATAWTSEAVRAAIHGNPEQKDRAIGVLLDAYFPRELGPGGKAVGLWATEQLCPDNHTHQHLAGTAMARVAAVKSGHPELLARSAELLRATSAAFQALATPAPDFFISSAGTRCKGKPIWWWGTAFLRQLMGQPGPMEPFVRKPDLWQDRAAVGVRALRWLQGTDPQTGKRRDDLGGADKVGPAGCKLKLETLVYRGKDRHLVVLPKPEKKAPKGVCDWVLVPWGLKNYEATMNALEFGLDWTTPPPKPPAGAELITFPSMW